VQTRGKRIAISGAGPAGLATAWQLGRRGHRVTGLERQDEPGGMCQAAVVDGRPYDLGAVLLSWEYAHTFRFVRRYGVETEPIAPFYLLDRGTGEVLPLEWLAKQHRERDLLAAVARYFGQLAWHHRHTGGPGFRDLEGTDLHLPFDQWLAKHDMGALTDLFVVPVTCYGYGDVSEIPAAYALKYMNFGNFSTNLYISGVEALGAPLEWPKKLVGGMHGLMTLIAGDLRRVLCGAQIEQIERGAGGADPVRVTWRQGEGAATSEGFDALIVAAKPDLGTLRDLPMELSPTEQRLFGALVAHDFFTIVGPAEGLGYGLYSAVVKDGVFSLPGLGEPLFMGRLYEDSPVLNVYAQAAPGVTGDQVLDTVLPALADMKITMRRQDVVTVRHWRYFPHAPSAAIEAGFYRDLEAMQGQNATWYVGSIGAFECVEDAMGYGIEVAEKDF